jgi:hypothetical protein
MNVTSDEYGPQLIAFFALTLNLYNDPGVSPDFV